MPNVLDRIHISQKRPLLRTIPEVLVAPFGGLLADAYDRKWLMVRLDCISILPLLGFIYAVQKEKVMFLYAASAARSVITAAYMPVTQSIVPLIVHDMEDLKRAATINGMIWSGMLVVGGVIAGGASARFGVEFCYIVDGLTYALSALIMTNVEGNFKVDEPKKNKDPLQTEQATIVKSLKRMFQMQKEVFKYLWHSGFGLLIFLKASGCLIWASSEVLNVSFSNVDGDEAETSRRMGKIYSAIGTGCLIGPIIANSTIVDGKRPCTIQLAMIGAFTFMTVSWLGLATSSKSLKSICFFSVVRTIGSAIVWLFSTVLLQNLAKPEFLGRILGFEYCLAKLSETIMAFVAGQMEDVGYSNSEISNFSAMLSFFFLVFWTIYHVRGKGAAQPKFNMNESRSIADTDKIMKFENENSIMLT